ISGVINIITKKGEEKPTLTITPSFGSFSFNNQRITFSGKDNKFSYAITGEHLNTSGWRDRTGFNSKGLGINLSFNPKEDLMINLNLSGLSEYYEMPGGLTKTQMETNPRQAQNQNDDAEYDFFNVNLGIEKNINPNNKFQVNFAYGRKDGVSNMENWSSFNSTLLETFSITPKYILTNPFFGRENKLILGIDFYNQPLNIKQYGERERTNLINEANIKKISTGFYLHNDFYITNNFIFTFGGRYENAKISAKDTSNPLQSKNFKGIAYNSTFTYFIPEKTKIFLKYDKVYRYPFTDEIAYYYGWVPLVFFNQDLKPEKGNSFEIGTEVYSLKDLKLGLFVFYNILKDEIFYNLNTWMNENIGKTKRFGIEFKGDWEITEFINLHWVYTYIDAKLDYEPYINKKIPLVPPHKGVIGLTFNLPFDISLTTDFILTDDMYLGGDYDNNQQPLSGYATVDVLLRYKPKKFEKNNLNFYFGIENLFNRIYANYGFEGWSENSYYPASGRMYKGGVSFSF
ncbi:MAG: TonB-dependent receptor, partial [bacterium]|nr:TonB-dependent receptor [bacterium]MDW8164862.1 TonB-dependent receptor [Candidatus Omnitrophota bacterium]